jgi:hypothetical protein
MNLKGSFVSSALALSVFGTGLGCGGTSYLPNGGGSSSSGSSSGGGSSGGGSSGGGSSSGGSSGSGGSSSGGASSGGSSSGGGLTGPACTTTADCTSGDECLYAVGSCSAKGQCLAPSQLGAQCGIVVTYCGCNGQTIGGICGANYASGPTLGQPAPCSPTPTLPSGGTLSTLAQVSGSVPEFLAVDGTNVYFTATGLGSVLSAPIGGGGAGAVVLASGQDQPIGIAVSGGNVIWTNESSGSTNGTVMKVATGGGTPVTLASGQGAPYEIAVDGANVYWTNITAPLGVMTVPIAGGTPTQFAPGTSPWAITAHDGNVYWTDGDAILTEPSGGGTIVTLASGQPFPFALAADSSNVYFTTSRGAGALLSMPLAGGAPTTLFAGAADSRLAIDTTSIYFTLPGAANDGSVLSIPLAGGTVATLVTGQAAPEAIVVDGTSAYWVDTYASAVMKLTPK